MEGVRVAYTLEQCWHRVPGGTAVSAIEVARAMPMAISLSTWLDYPFLVHCSMKPHFGCVNLEWNVF